jgi:hypothetical protein
VVVGLPGLTREGLPAGAEDLGGYMLLDPGEAAGGVAGVDTVTLLNISLADLGPGDILVA